MKIFSKFYQTVLTWAGYRYASVYLGFLSFIESFILPYPPPDILLAPMTLKNPQKAYQFAFVCTLFSVLGGVVGYLIGAFFIDLIMPLIEKMHYLDELDTVKDYFTQYGVLIIIIAGFSPVPYKIFTIGAGVVSMVFLPFVVFSFLSRGARFFLVTFLVKKFGQECDTWLKKYIDRLGYALILIIFIGVWYANISN